MPDQPHDRDPERGDGSDDGVEEAVEDAIEFFSPDEEEQQEGDLVRHPPDGTKRPDDRAG